MGNNSDKIVAAGLRTAQDHKSSILISLPQKEIEEKVGIDPEDLKGRNLMVRLHESGLFEVDITPQGSDLDDTQRDPDLGPRGSPSRSRGSERAEPRQ